ncbi:SURF1 family protein [Rickettsiales endosymbiont of Stachyamoeba lipophora]|uniref:SURF1 family protein n=1 Tax=Rickettsiales endosymbiont of Stachyamoeba lipophora TaxID=2486578 RepID=UPI000F64B40F|nr:SURF1 family protein [Rickettsiales endosymbiont of Stachyamoeba lipophora]AZL15890.1 SURF1 family protein [Rickettsiales endosymbiont of Stachyamoeba lipophora]
MMKKKSKLILPCISFGIMFVILIFLGAWQLKRLDYKEHLIQGIQAKTDLPIMEISCKDLERNFNQDSFYRKIKINGHYDNSENLFVYAGPMAIRGKPGYFMLSKFICDDGTNLLVNQGWVETSHLNSYKNNDPAVNVNLNATIMPSEKPGTFTPENELNKNIWYYIDIKQAAKHWKTDFSNFYLMRSYENSIYPIGKNPSPNLKNNHLSYAITWFSLAIILAGIFYFRFISSPRSS